MKVTDIDSPENCARFIEGCINDFEAGISNKNETMGLLLDMVILVIGLAKAGKTEKAAEKLPEITEEDVEDAIKDVFKEHTPANVILAHLQAHWIEEKTYQYFNKWKAKRLEK